jgi:DNA-binding response OmpR family regulator
MFTVLVLGGLGLESLLPAPIAAAAPSGPAPDCVVVPSTDAGQVRRVRAEHPGAAVLAVVPRSADGRLVVAILTAGADACVRETDPRAIVAHLAALHRRWARERGGSHENLILVSEPSNPDSSVSEA